MASSHGARSHASLLAGGVAGRTGAVMAAMVENVQKRKTKRGKGTKWMVLVDGEGLPLGVRLESASPAEVTLAENTLAEVRVPRPKGRPRQRPERVIADRGCVIPDGMVVGEDAKLDGQRFFRSPSGITLITREMLQRLDGTTQEDLH